MTDGPYAGVVGRIRRDPSGLPKILNMQPRIFIRQE